MGKQISLDGWQENRLADLLHRGSENVERTGKPIILYRQTIEEDENNYEEVVCSLVKDHVIEQIVISGGMIVPSFVQQDVYSIDEYPAIILGKSKERFRELVDKMEKEFDQQMQHTNGTSES